MVPELPLTSEALAGFRSYIIPRHRLGEFWPLIRGGVVDVIEHSGRPTFTPEDVYTAIATNRAALVATFKHDMYAGFVVLGHDVDQFSGQKSLLIWLAYAHQPLATEATMPYLEAIAKNRGFQHLVFHTTRKGWLKRGPEIGFELREYIYAKRIS